jgi:hypothetical protein
MDLTSTPVVGSQIHLMNQREYFSYVTWWKMHSYAWYLLHGSLLLALPFIPLGGGDVLL